MNGRRSDISSARSLALHVLMRVTQDQAYAAAALSQALAESDLPGSERGLATELCYGVLRADPYLRRRLERHTDLRRTDAQIGLILCLGAYQLEFLDRVPAHAAVSECVELARSTGTWATGFVNAVLRKVATDTEGRLPREQAIWSSVPAWLRKRLERDVGEAEARGLLVPAEAPRPDVRLRPGRQRPVDLELEDTLLASAKRFVAGGDPRRHPGFAAGDFVLQELGSQLVAALSAVQPGQRVLDACAGRGQKTACLLDLGADVLATDLHEHKLRALSGELTRLGLAAETRVVDFTRAPPDDLLGAFDVVLLDAPCTGTGTLRRRPEIMRRLAPESPAELAELQLRLLRQTALCLKPGGRLIYSICSVLRQEAEDVLAAAADVLQPASLPTLDLDWLGSFGQAAGGTSVRLLPGTTQSDGYFVAQVVLRAG
jgi:16S rRNA (cytosine967-C5)-methyltransferase